MAGAVKFEARIKELVENLPDLAALVEPLLVVRRGSRTARDPAPAYWPSCGTMRCAGADASPASAPGSVVLSRYRRRAGALP